MKLPTPEVLAALAVQILFNDPNMEITYKRRDEAVEIAFDLWERCAVYLEKETEAQR